MSNPNPSSSATRTPSPQLQESLAWFFETRWFSLRRQRHTVVGEVQDYDTPLPPSTQYAPLYPPPTPPSSSTQPLECGAVFRSAMRERRPQSAHANARLRPAHGAFRGSAWQVKGGEAASISDGGNRLTTNSRPASARGAGESRASGVPWTPRCSYVLNRPASSVVPLSSPTTPAVGEPAAVGTSISVPTRPLSANVVSTRPIVPQSESPLPATVGAELAAVETQPRTPADENDNVPATGAVRSVEQAPRSAPPAAACSSSSSFGDKGRSSPKRGSLYNMREVGSVAVALTKAQRIDASINTDVLAARGINAAALDKILDRLPRFFNRARGKMLLASTRARRRDAAPSLAEQWSGSAHQRYEPTDGVFTFGDAPQQDSQAVAMPRVVLERRVDQTAIAAVDFVCRVAVRRRRGLDVTRRVVRSNDISSCATEVEEATVALPWNNLVAVDELSITDGCATIMFVAPIEDPHSNAAKDCQTWTVRVTGEARDLVALLALCLGQRAALGAQLIRHLQRRTFHIVHFNDVYHLEPFHSPDGCGVIGGASRFLTKLREIQQYRNPLILFSGDFMGPSLQSVVVKGRQMIDAFNLVGVHFGTFGNHEFDYGIEALRDCVQGAAFGSSVFAGSNTKWIMTNMFECDSAASTKADTSANGTLHAQPVTWRPLGGALPYAVVVWNGVRIGLLGLSENWLPSCNQLSQSKVQYRNVILEGESMAKFLKEHHGAECVVAMTHSRIATDRDVASHCPSIDLILGGHDHFYRNLPACRLVKSGEEFQFLTEVEVAVGDDGCVRHRAMAHPITAAIHPDPAMERLRLRYESRVHLRMSKVIGISTVPLDVTEACCRFREGMLTGFICDVMAQRTGADFAVLGGAAIAGKTVTPAGDITIGDVFSWFPNDTRVMCVRIPGTAVQRLLDVMVREVPLEAPSFPHPSEQLRFTINTMHSPARVQSITIGGEPLDPVRRYVVAVEDFVGLGKAKYKFILQEGEAVVDEECAEQLTYWIIDYFDVTRGRRAESGARQELDSVDHGDNSEVLSASLLRAMDVLGKSSTTGGKKSVSVATKSRRASQRPQLSGLMVNCIKKHLLSKQLQAVPEAESSNGDMADAFPVDGEGLDSPHVTAAKGSNTQDVASTPSSLRPAHPLPEMLTATSLRAVFEQLERVSTVAKKPLAVVATACCYAAQRLLRCDAARLFFHDGVATSCSCVAPVCRFVIPTSVAAHPSLGTYNAVRFSRKPIVVRDCSEVQHASFHWASERHPRGTALTSYVTMPVHVSSARSVVLQCLNISADLGNNESEVAASLEPLRLFLTHASVLLQLAHERALHEQTNALQRAVFDAALELLGTEDIHSARLLDQLSNVTKSLRTLFQAKDCRVLMIDYPTNEVWWSSRVHTSRHDVEDVVTRRPLDEDPYVASAVASGLPTLQDPATVDDVAASLLLVDQAVSSHADARRSATLAIPVFLPGTEDIFCVLRLSERPYHTPFTTHDEDAAVTYSAFVAVAIRTGSEVECLRTGVDRSALKALPVHELNRIQWKRGWGIVRSKRRVIVSEDFRNKLHHEESDRAFDAFGTSWSAGEPVD